MSRRLPDYAFARRGNRIRVENGRARVTSGHDRPMSDWGALIRDNHEGYITWAEFEENQRMFQENAHMQSVPLARPDAVARPC